MTDRPTASRPGETASGPLDAWASWLLHERFRDLDDTARREALDTLVRWRDRILDGARIRPTDTVLDAGAGTGLLAWGASARAEDGRVIALDLSRDALTGLGQLEAIADAGMSLVCGSVVAVPLATATVDVVVQRAVLIYVTRKQDALEEYRRVLRPGGRLSLLEPVNRDRRWVIEVDALPARFRDAARTLMRPIGAGPDPMLDTDADDLAAMARQAGFTDLDVTLTTHVDALTSPDAVTAYVDRRPAPNRPPPRVTLRRSLGADVADGLVVALAAAAADHPIRFETPLCFLTARTTDVTDAAVQSGAVR